MTIDSHAWIEQMEQLANASSVRHLDILVDQMGSATRVLPAMQVIQPPVPWCSLFDGMPEETLLDQAPLLMRINLEIWQHKAWLAEVMKHFMAEPRLLIVISSLPFQTLSTALQTLSQLQWGGQTGLLRFYDPRVWPCLLNDVLNDAQRQRFLELGLFIGWLDHDQAPTWVSGHYPVGQAVDKRTDPILLSDEQYGRLGCISDAQRLLPWMRTRFAALSAQACFDRSYEIARLANDSNEFGELTAFAVRQLNEVSSASGLRACPK